MLANAIPHHANTRFLAVVLAKRVHKKRINNGIVKNASTINILSNERITSENGKNNLMP